MNRQLALFGKLNIMLALAFTLSGCGALSPVADAGPDQTVELGQTATLSAAASDKKNGDSLKYYWTITTAPEGSLAQLTDPRAMAPAFTPDKLGDYTVQLIVDNHYWPSEPDEVKVTCTPATIAVDPAGKIVARTLTAVESYRTTTHVSFSVKFSVSNTGTTRVNIGIPILGKDADGNVVFSQLSNLALDPDETKDATISYGEALTITEYDNITTWTAGEIVTY